MKEEKPNNVLYLTCLENTVKNDIHDSQILGLKNNGVPYIFLFLSPRFIWGRAGFSVNKNKFTNSAIKEVKLPLFSANLVMHVFIIPYFLIVACPILLYYIHKEHIGIVHCRNLVSSLLAVFCKVCLFQNIKVVCDPRSVYVEEGVIIGRFKYQGFNYRVWKKLERWIYKMSDYCLGLSDNFTNYLKRYNPNSTFIPAVVRPSFIYDSHKRESLREELRLTPQHHVLIYVGSIGQWHSVEMLIKSIDAYKKSLDSDGVIRIIFLSGNTSACEEIKRHYSNEEIIKCGRVTPGEVLNYLQVSDLGIVPGTNKDGFCYDLLYETMLSSKAEEFLAVGLPIIVNKRIVSLDNMLRKQHYCIEFDGENVFCQPINRSRSELSIYFNTMFNAKTVVGRYEKLYESLTTS